ncbi:MAG: cysteine protease StiP family protein [Synergistaceae bacterium]|nr:cysteine protease StiP family protein [Synergistaceae bacterium]
MNGSFLPGDVTLLLKDITGSLAPIPTRERELLIQSGTHYSEMLPLEYAPSPEYMRAFELALDNFAEMTASAVARVSGKIYRRRGKNVVLVSLARSGTPIGILLKRYMKRGYGVNVPHYGISIIRGRGIDKNAVKFILDRHPPDTLQFVDGWTGKGAILRELKSALTEFPGIDQEMAVLADPPRLTSLSGTREDFLIASACLNSTVCGMMSRTILHSDLIGEGDFHGCVFYDKLKDEDKTYTFIDRIESRFKFERYEAETPVAMEFDGMEEAREIASEFNISDINLIKPGVGETTRVLLRRVPGVVLFKPGCDSRYISHLITLAREKNTPTMEYPLVNYNACGIIKTVPADAHT